VTSNLTGSTVTQSGPPNAYAVDLGSTNPSNGENITYRFTAARRVERKHHDDRTTSTNPGPNQFAIGATSDMTASNLQAALAAAVGKLADTSLAAASAMAAANDFFGNPPQRVAGSPLTSATGFVAGTAADTVSWYIGESGTDPARGTATAQVDPSISVSYGVRAEEQGIRWVVQNVAALAAMTFSQSDPNAAARSMALDQRVATALDVPPGTQKVEDIEAELAGAQVTLAAGDRSPHSDQEHAGRHVGQIEGISNEDVASKIMALQTSLQASMQTTSLLFKTSLVNYI